MTSEPNYNKFFTENLLVTEIKIQQIYMNKPVYLGLELSKILMCEFWYD